MAVMEGVALEQKPLPSSEVVLNPGVIGNSNGDKPDLNLVDNASAPAPKALNISPSLDFTSPSADLNGSSHNMDAFTSNQTIITPIDLPVESQPTEASLTSLDLPPSSHLPESSTTASDDQQQLPEPESTLAIASNEPESAITPAVESATETEITSALQDTTATSTVPLAVEAQESDLRDITSPLALQKPISQSSSEAQDSSAVMDSLFGDAAHSDVAVESSSAIHPSAIPSDSLATETKTMTLNAPAASTAPEATDSVMADAPESSTFIKIARERDGDDGDEPTAKRPKVDEEEDAAMADVPMQDSLVSETTADVQNNDVAPASSAPISAYQVKEIIKLLKNIARTKVGRDFGRPVGQIWPELADSYNLKISHPVDFQTIEANFKESKYATMDDFKAEVNLIVDNAITFNGDGHGVTLAARNIRDQIFNKIAQTPAEPVVVPKPPKKQARQSTPRTENTARTTPIRRKSKSVGTGPVIPPAPIFALDPVTNTPLIRRDSTKNDAGRPKRDIHPPKNKDLPYSMSRPKNKKAATEMKFVDHVLAEMKKQKHSTYAWPFLAPVDPVSLGIPAYFQIIKRPMDLGTIEANINKGEIQNAKQFESDMKQVFSNCYKFNPPENDIHQLGKKFEAVFSELWANKNQWIADHAPAAQTPSSGGSDDEESEEEEFEDTSADQAALAQLSQRLNEEQEKMIKLMEDKSSKGNQQALELQRDMVELVKNKLNAAKKPAPKKAVKKPKAAPKKPAASKKSAGGSKKAAKEKTFMGTHEKNVISIGIGRLPDHLTQEVLAMIKATTDIGDDDGEIELDIDSVPVEVLWQIHTLVVHNVPDIDNEAGDQMVEEAATPPPPAKPAAKKKNKPMSKGEQERKIQLLENTIGDFNRNSSGSQEPVPTVENAENAADDSSGDEDDESEEED